MMNFACNWIQLFCLCYIGSSQSFKSTFTREYRTAFNRLNMQFDHPPVLVNGLPGPMALETAKVCLDRGLKLVPIGFTGPNCKIDKIQVDGKTSSQTVKLVKGLGSAATATDELLNAKKQYPDLIIIDYTTPSAAPKNLECYIENSCDFVMGTTGMEQNAINKAFESANSYAVIAPNMAKQIVAVQAAVLSMATRFPKSFSNYKLTVTESHQSTKKDTSGTAKAIVAHLAALNGENFNTEQIVQLREKDLQLAFAVPEDALDGHAFHTYTLHSAVDRVTFELKHNVCGRRVYAEGTVDAVVFLEMIRREKASKRLYNMIDVLESAQ